MAELNQVTLEREGQLKLVVGGNVLIQLHCIALIIMEKSANQVKGGIVEEGVKANED